MYQISRSKVTAFGSYALLVAMLILSANTSLLSEEDATEQSGYLDALMARSQQLMSADFAIGRTITKLPDEVGPFSVDLRILKDADRFVVEEPRRTQAFDGATYYDLSISATRVFLGPDSPENPTAHYGIDVGKLGNINDRLFNYFKTHSERIRLETSGKNDEYITLSLDIPKEDLHESLYSYTSVLREGAIVTLLIGLSESLPLLQMEWRSTDKRFSGMLGHREKWSDWQEVKPGVWIPGTHVFENYDVRSGEETLVFANQFRIKAQRVNEEISVDEFRLEIPAGYEVRDHRFGSPLRYVYKGGSLPEDITDPRDLTLDDETLGIHAEITTIEDTDVAKKADDGIVLQEAQEDITSPKGSTMGFSVIASVGAGIILVLAIVFISMRRQTVATQKRS